MKQQYAYLQLHYDNCVMLLNELTRYDNQQLPYDNSVIIVLINYIEGIAHFKSVPTAIQELNLKCSFLYVAKEDSHRTYSRTTGIS